ncbi:adenylate/guanylate cyclase domain-containing protein [Candidatus Gracilibacteria bacterium]|nr:adenylate/guanylate cyclase domain-containing protein [Candidatus Gracilibacteria bacterium]
MIHALKKNTQLLTIFLSCIVFLILLSASSSFSSFNKDIQTQFYHLKNFFSPAQVNSNIVVIGIDEPSFDVIGQFPFERTIYAEAIENLNRLGVATVGLDLLLLDRSTELEDARLSRTLQDNGNVILGASIDREGRVYVPQIDVFGQYSDYGYVSPLVEASNRTVYSFRPKRTFEDGGEFEHFTLRILRNYYSTLFERDYFGFGSYRSRSYFFSPLGDIPLSKPYEEEILIRFTSPESFRYISFSDILDQEKLYEIQENQSLRDAIILIGPAAEGLKDEFFTPNKVEYGVFIHANILNTLLTHQYLLYFHRLYEWVLIFCIILLSVSVNFSSRTIVLVYGNFVIFFLFTLFIPITILLFSNLIFNFPFEIIASFFLSFGISNLVKYLIEDTNKQKLGKALSEYVSSDIMEEVLHEHGKVYLDGEKKELIVYFSDIEHFTEISEKLSPEELVMFLREYLGEFTEILMKHGAYIDKYEGDSIMALWGAFASLNLKESHKVCESLLEQKLAIKKLSKHWKQKLGRELRVRTGIHLGDAIVGNIGAPGRKMNFTALGDSINLASRLEGVNKYYGTYICVSEEFVKNTGEIYIFCEIDTIKVLGKDIGVKIYELLGKEGEISKKLLIQKEQYEHALELYRKQDFIRASELFRELSSEGFKPAYTLLSRSENFLTTPPDKNWDGVWIMEGK